ncbi:hypothetical protein GTR02_15080 [Kineococcus sp. R8]|uniref:hypothetical protein n=1 Tax=Kineococcus siccus TaxID=2696567 RepID=UPI0014120B28|nr:hypothetical protein [Kineococcus siccus]NAZ83142.1 hypothetical protein [Kineococcus siccus]
MRRWPTHLTGTLPPLLLAGIGLSHPMELTPETAGWWTTMHIVLVPVFPLLGVGLWFLVRGVPGVLAWAVRVAAFLYASFYGVVDAVAGIGAGALVSNGVAAGRGPDADGRDPALDHLFAIGNEVGTVGGWAFLAGSAALAVLAWRRWGPAALPGGLLTVAAAWSFVGSHIYWPLGVATMVALALGLGLLGEARLRHEDRARGPVGDRAA